MAYDRLRVRPGTLEAGQSICVVSRDEASGFRRRSHPAMGLRWQLTFEFEPVQWDRPSDEIHPLLRVPRAIRSVLTEREWVLRARGSAAPNSIERIFLPAILPFNPSGTPPQRSIESLLVTSMM